MVIICDRCQAATEVTLDYLFSVPTGRRHIIACDCCSISLFVADAQILETKETPA